MIRIQKEDFSVDEVISALKQTESGAIVTFSGSVRGTSKDGSTVEGMEWDVYPSMAEKILSIIREQAIQKFDLLDVAIIHRYGNHQPGDNLVLIVAVSRHRQEAFQSCEWIMDEIKKQAPFWKKEILSDGRERWIEG